MHTHARVRVKIKHILYQHRSPAFYLAHLNTDLKHGHLSDTDTFLFHASCLFCLTSTMPEMTEDETVGWHHRLNGHEFEWTPGIGEGQGGLACCSPWGRKESGMTEWLSWTELMPENSCLEWWVCLQLWDISVRWISPSCLSSPSLHVLNCHMGWRPLLDFSEVLQREDTSSSGIFESLNHKCDLSFHWSLIANWNPG